MVSFRARVVILITALWLASFVSACCSCQDCCKEVACQVDSKHPVPGMVVVDPDALSNPTYAPKSDGSNPRIYGRARFQGTVITFEVMSLESSPPEAEKLVINWTSHTNATVPILWPVLAQNDPLHTYTIPAPKTRWYVVDIPATWDASGSNDCFHIRVDAYDHAGNLLMSAGKKFIPGIDVAQWEDASDPI